MKTCRFGTVLAIFIFCYHPSKFLDLVFQICSLLFSVRGELPMQMSDYVERKIIAQDFQTRSKNSSSRYEPLRLTKTLRHFGDSLAKPACKLVEGSHNPVRYQDFYCRPPKWTGLETNTQEGQFRLRSSETNLENLCRGGWYRNSCWEEEKWKATKKVRRCREGGYAEAWRDRGGYYATRWKKTITCKSKQTKNTTRHHTSRGNLSCGFSSKH